MADIQAFHGLRYDLSKVGSLADVVAPPYDVIDPEFQDRLYQRHANNVVRLILNRGDDLNDGESIYDRAAHDFKTWQREGVIRKDSLPSIYVYHQTFEANGQQFRRRGFLARVKIEPFGEGRIYPHEETHSKAKEDRYKLMTACQANLSPIFSIYPDPENEAQEILETAIGDNTPLTATDHLGVVHELWLVTDPTAISKAASVMGAKPLFIADGHHRYETALNIQQQYRQQHPGERDHPTDYVLMSCVSMDDPGMIVLPTHRLFRGVQPITSTELVDQLGESFDCERVGTGTRLAEDIWARVELEDRQSTMGFYCRADDTWIMARLTEAGRARMDRLMADRSEEWRSLGVALLHKLVMDDLLGYQDLPTPLYVRELDLVESALREGDGEGRDATGQQGSGQPFNLGCIVMPATLDHVRAISEHGERMPAKSTYFYPKMLSGLLFNPLDS